MKVFGIIASVLLISSAATAQVSDANIRTNANGQAVSTASLTRSQPVLEHKMKLLPVRLTKAKDVFVKRMQEKQAEGTLPVPAKKD